MTKGIELATAYIQIVSSSKDLGKDVIKQVGAAGDEGGKVAGDNAGKSLVGHLGGFLKKSMIGLGATAAGLLTTSLVKGWSRLTNIENATAKLTGLGNSATAVKGIMDNALKSVKGTAFGLDEAATTAAAVVAAGIKPGKELQSVLNTVADTATIAGKSMKDTGAIFGSVAARGKLQGDDLLQLQSAGVPVLAMLAKHYGITAAAASQMVTKGKVDFASFNAALQENLGGAAKKSGETTQGALKNMWAAFGRFGAMLLQGVFPAAKGVFGAINGWVDALTAKLGPLVAKASTWAAAWGSKIVAGIKSEFESGSGSVFDLLWSGLTMNSKQRKQFADSLSTTPIMAFGANVRAAFDKAHSVTSEAALNFWSGLTMDKATRAKFAQDLATNPIMNVGAQVRTAFDKAQAAASAGSTRLRTALSQSVGEAPKGVVLSWGDIVYNGIGLASNKISGAAQNIASKTQTALSAALGSTHPLPWSTILTTGLDKAVATVKTTLGPTMEGTVSHLKSIWGKLADTGKRAFGPLTDIVKTLASAFADAFQAVGSSGLSVWGLLLKLADGLASVLQDYLVPALQGIASWMAKNKPLLTAVTVGLIAYRSAMFAVTAVTKVATVVTGLWTAAQKLLNVALKANPIGIVITAVAALAAGFIYLWNNSKGFRDFWIGLWDKIKTVATTVADWFMDHIWPQIERAFDAISGVVKGVWKVFQGIVDFVAGVFTGNWSRAWEGIKKIFGGVWDGIKAVAKLAIDWFGGVPGWIWDKIKAFAGWLGDRGRDLMNWIWGGIKGAAGAVWSWFTGIPGWIWDKVKGLATVLAGYGSSVMNWLWGGIKSAATAVWSWFTGIGGWIWEKIKDLAGTIGEYGGKIIGWIGDGIKNGVSALWSWVTDLPGKLWAGVKSIASDLGDIGHSIYQAITGGMRDAMLKDPTGDLLRQTKRSIGGAGALTSKAYAAGGAPADGLFTVGEQGPELAYKSGSYLRIFSNSDSRKVASAALRQPAEVVVTFRGDGVLTAAMAREASAQVMRGLSDHGRVLVGAR